MTPEQISALSDIELNRAVIWLYGYPDYGDPESLKDVIWWHGSYLEDYNATMPLAFSNDLSISVCNSAGRKAIIVCDSHSTHDNNPLRAICECLVLIALADK